MIPRQVRFRPYALPLSLLHGFVRQIEGETPLRWTMWLSRGTELTLRHSAKYATGISVIVGSPSGVSSLQHPNN